MELVTVKSSNIHAIGYDPESYRLRVEFRNGSTCDYLGVPETVHAELIAADSIGTYFYTHIRNHYAHKKLDK